MTAIRIIDSHLELADVGANDHHNELHTIVSHSDTSATGTQLDTLTDNSIADTLHRHSELVASDGSPDPALSVDAIGQVGIGITPSSPLHVAHDTASQLRLSDASDTNYWELRVGTRFIFKDNGVEKMRIDENGNVGIGASPATSAILELSSTIGALLLSRMTTIQKNALTAVNGMLVYDSTLNKFQGHENGSWTNLI